MSSLPSRSASSTTTSASLTTTPRCEHPIALSHPTIALNRARAPQILEDISEEKMESLLEVNNRSMVKMTRIVLPGMVSRKKGAIVNIGSFAGSTTDPFYSVYSGSKVCQSLRKTQHRLAALSPHPLYRHVPSIESDSFNLFFLLLCRHLSRCSPSPWPWS